MSESNEEAIEQPTDGIYRWWHATKRTQEQELEWRRREALNKQSKEEFEVKEVKSAERANIMKALTLKGNESTRIALTKFDRKNIRKLAEEEFQILSALPDFEKRKCSDFDNAPPIIDVYRPKPVRYLLDPDISNGLYSPPIPVYSDVKEDLRKPTYFEFITTCEIAVPVKDRGLNLKVPPDDAVPTCCSCVDGCKNYLECTCAHYNYPKSKGPFFREKGRVAVHDYLVHGAFVCGSGCRCRGKICENRMPKIRNITFEIFKRSSILGFGLRTLTNIQRGEIVGEFAGVIMAHNQLDMDDASEEYAFTLSNEYDPDHIGETECSDICVNPTRAGNHMRFITHSSRPNLKMMRVHTSDGYSETPLPYLYATEPIMAGAELSFDYGQDFVDKLMEMASTERRTFECLCPSSLCHDSEFMKTYGIPADLPTLITLMKKREICIRKQMRWAESERIREKPVTLYQDLLRVTMDDTIDSEGDSDADEAELEEYKNAYGNSEDAVKEMHKEKIRMSLIKKKYPRRSLYLRSRKQTIRKLKKKKIFEITEIDLTYDSDEPSSSNEQHDKATSRNSREAASSERQKTAKRRRKDDSIGEEEEEEF